MSSREGLSTDLDDDLSLLLLSKLAFSTFPTATPDRSLLWGSSIIVLLFGSPVTLAPVLKIERE
jgi:hypothetical protein